MHPRLHTHRSPGQSIVLVALALVLLVGVAGLGVDGANAFNQRRNAANAADAAAMAGASALIAQQRTNPNGPASAIYAAMAGYLSDHGVDPNSPATSWVPYYVDANGTRLGAVGNSSAPASSAAKGVSLDVQYTFDTWFMQILGRASLNASAAATAIFGPRKVSGGDLLPITMSQQAADEMRDHDGTSYVFGPDSGAFKVNAGNFGALSLDPSENDPNAIGNYSDCTSPSGTPDNPSYWWCNGTEHEINVGDWLYGDPGEIAGSLKDEVQWRITHNPIGLVPIYDTSNDLGGNNTQFRVVGFLVVELQSQHLTGNPKTITARYKDYVVSTGAIDPNAPVQGLYAINLIRTPGTLQ